MNILLPAGWSAHGAHRPASTVAGILPRSGVHLMVTTASPATLAAVLGDIACSVASNIVDAPLIAKPGAPRRSVTGFVGSRASVAPESVLILNSRSGLNLDEAIPAAVLARGVTRQLPIGWARVTAPLTEDSGAVRRLRDIGEAHFTVDIGLIIVVADFDGSRAGDASMWRAVNAIAGAFPAPVLLVTSREPAEIPAETVIARLDDKTLGVENPLGGVAFSATIEREDVLLDNSDTVVVARTGPRRAFEGAKRVAPVVAEKPSVGRPKATEKAERIFLVQTGRQLSADEARQFTGGVVTDDYMNAIRRAGESTEKFAEIVIVPSNRDPRREAAGSVAQRTKAQIKNAGLDTKVSVRVADDLVIAA